MKKEDELLKQESRSRIIENLYKNKSIGLLIKKAANGRNEIFEDELRSNIFLYLCEMNVDKLIGLHDRDEIIPYIISKITKQKTDRYKGSVNSQIDYVPNRTDNAIDLYEDTGYLMDFLKDESGNSIDVVSAIENLNWFEKRILELYVEYGSIKDVMEHTGADGKYIVKVMNSIRTKVKNDLR
jgi:hypothetical protein